MRLRLVFFSFRGANGDFVGLHMHTRYTPRANVLALGTGGNIDARTRIGACANQVSEDLRVRVCRVHADVS